MSGEGGEQLVLNTQERALSTDVNRAQAFRTRDAAEMFRNLLSIYTGFDDLDGGGLAVPTVQATGGPLPAEVMGGLLVQPQIGSLNLLITPGLAFCVNPSGNPDNSVYEFVNDPGVQTLGALVMTANPSGSARCDVIECQPQDVVQEEDNRDIFNPATGSFTAQSVTKATQAQMVYRVRPGTPGAGFPGVVAGWLPLCVALAQAGATTCDQMDFWDVRPLANDRAYGLAKAEGDAAPGSLSWTLGFFYAGAVYPDVRGQLYAGVVSSGLNANIVQGVVSARINGRRVGGVVMRGTPGVDPTNYASFDLSQAANQSPGLASLTSGSGALFYLYLCCPYGLPRWCLYTPPLATGGSWPGGAPRAPRAPRGVLVVSDVIPDANGSPSTSTSVPLPSAMFGASASCEGSFAVCVAAVPRRVGGGYTAWSMHDKFVSWPSYAGFGSTALTLDGASTGQLVQFDTPAGFLPPMAVRAKVQLAWSLSPGSADPSWITWNRTAYVGNSSFTRDSRYWGTPVYAAPTLGTSAVLTDALVEEFPVGCNPLAAVAPMPSFYLPLQATDSTATHMTLKTGAGQTYAGYLGYWNP
jgi:hypothetical protein